MSPIQTNSCDTFFTRTEYHHIPWLPSGLASEAYPSTTPDRNTITKSLDHVRHNMTTSQQQFGLRSQLKPAPYCTAERHKPSSKTTLPTTLLIAVHQSPLNKSYQIRTSHPPLSLDILPSTTRSSLGLYTPNEQTPRLQQHSWNDDSQCYIVNW